MNKTTNKKKSKGSDDEKKKASGLGCAHGHKGLKRVLQTGFQHGRPCDQCSADGWHAWPSVRGYEMSSNCRAGVSCCPVTTSPVASGIVTGEGRYRSKSGFKLNKNETAATSWSSGYNTV